MAETVFTRKYSLDGGNGSNIPIGGAAGDVLTKKTSIDYDVQWEAPKDWTTEFSPLTSAAIDTIIAGIN